MKEVDARGLSCPEPLMMAADAIKKGNGPVKVVVDDATPKINIEKYAKSQGKKVTITEKGLEFEIVIE